MALQDIIAKVDSLKKELDSLLPMKKEAEERLWKKFRLEFNYNSNHIEGNTLTYGETELLLLKGDTTGNHTYREYEEMKGHDLAFDIIQRWAQDSEHPLNEAMIKELNKIILKEPFWQEAETLGGQKTERLIKIGGYKEFPNHVRLQNGEIFEYATPTDTPIKMGELIEWYRQEKEKKELHPSVLAALFHYRFIRIHPFDDGNGRVSRLLMNYILLQNSFLPVIVKSADKPNYLAALRRADIGDLDAIVEYLLNGLFWSLQISIKAAKGENIEEEEDLDKRISILKSELAANGEEDAKIIFSKSAFIEIYDSWLSQLMSDFIIEVKKFNDLFVNPSHWISINTGLLHGHGGVRFTENFVNTQEGEIIKKLRQHIDKTPSIHSDVEVKMNAIYGLFKKGAAKNPFGANFSIEVFFDYTKFEIYITDNIFDVESYPQINEDLINNLKKYEEYEKVYFNGMGNYFLTPIPPIEKDGKYYIDDQEIKIIYSRNEILNGSVKSGGKIRIVNSRLLHKPLEKEEIKAICKKMANNIYEHIDYFTKRNGLR